ncbi:glutaredoxin family protein [Dissulfurirhabdus thermomarina]|uniref:Glutaredoxin family protein n=1 Tax=Dissulfurirhabdus thermomarina TaxID=1765737 RepID=A0A6N9TM46_DISTH|nr:glutaredoxin family protein [Dissulfurirhabdus thermomarina]NDY42118.1 glutaredoxin family protein [Dissulfurirhabdus thermomarina]NMX22860.1 glutaredoxin family protein [Dissulfurirhabdus thermomarina]
MTSGPVKLYALSTCGHCRAAKRLLDALAVAYDVTDVDLLEGEERASAVAEVRRLNPRCSFPTLVVGEEVVVGYREDEIRRVLGVAP